MQKSPDQIVAGTVVSLNGEHSDEPHLHGVQSRMRLGDVVSLTNKPTAHSIDVVLPGGTWNGVNVTVPGAPCFRVGEQVVLLLRANADDFYLLGHGMGVLRRSSDGEWIQPDIAVEQGPPAVGEAFETFARRFAMLHYSSLNRPGQNVLRAIGITLLALLVLVCLILRRGKKKFLLVIFGAGLAFHSFWRPTPAAAAMRSREFQIQGPKWDLKTQLRGRVHNGRVVWTRGHGSRSLADADAFATIQKTLQQWEDIPESAIAFSEDGQSVNAGNATDDRNVISFNIDPPHSAFDRFTLAVTFGISDETGANFTEADTVFNDRDVKWKIGSGDFALEVVSLHENGHFLGLAHSSDPHDVMFPTAMGLRVLSTSDRAGAAYLYPVTSPLAFASASPTSGGAPLTVSFTSDGSGSTDGSPVSMLWNFGDGTTTNANPTVQHTYVATGNFTATLTVTDNKGATATSSVGISVAGSTQALTVTQFSFQAALAPPKNSSGRDKLALTVTGLDLQPGDSVNIDIAGVLYGTQDINNPPTANRSTSPLLLDANGTFTGPSSAGGTISLTRDPKSGGMKLQLSGASLARNLDPRDPLTTSLSGTASFPMSFLVTRTSGESVAFAGTLDFGFKVRTGRTASGFVEIAIQGKH